jgi:hypothetical protein
MEQYDSTAEQPSGHDRPPKRFVGGPSTLARFSRWAILGCLAGVVISLIALRIANHDPTPELTPALFESARQRWKAAAPSDYDIEVRVEGPQAATYRVEVRGGQAAAAWRNGKPLRSVRTFGTWSVPGMFSTISRDVETIERQAEGRADPAIPPLILRAAFDSQYSFPQRYSRIEWGSRKGSTATAVTWEVVEFKALQ